MNTFAMLARKLGIYLTAVMVTYLLASITATQHVVISLRSMNVDIPIGENLAMVLRDLIGMAGMFLPLIAAGLLLAFLVTALLCVWLRRWQGILYPLAGAAAIVAIHVLLNLALGLTPVAIARSAGGVLVQAAAGAVGGWLYIRLNNSLFRHGTFDITE